MTENIIHPEFNADTREQKANILDRMEALAVFSPTTRVIVPPVPAWVNIPK